MKQSQPGTIAFNDPAVDRAWKHLQGGLLRRPKFRDITVLLKAEADAFRQQTDLQHAEAIETFIALDTKKKLVQAAEWFADRKQVLQIVIANKQRAARQNSFKSAKPDRTEKLVKACKNGIRLLRDQIPNKPF